MSNRYGYQYYLEIFENFREAPCPYCPGNCITSCPTFIWTRNTLYSPLGYTRSLDKAVNNCLRCWRCTFSCPVEYPLPILVEEITKTRIEKPFVFAVVKDGEKYLVGELDYTDMMKTFSEKVGLGIVAFDYNGSLGNRDFSIDIEGKEIIGYSPEASFILGVPHYSEVLSEFIGNLEISIRLHIPCLLLPRKNEIISSLEKTGITVEEVVKDVCIRMENTRDTLKDLYTLCPKALESGAKLLDELLIKLIDS